MSLLTKVLAFLNLLGAGVLGYYVSQVAMARHEWEKTLADHDRQIAGNSTEEIVALFKAKRPQDHARIFSGPLAPQSAERQREAVVRALFDPEKPEMLYGKEADAIKREYGLNADDLRFVIQSQIPIETSKIAREAERLQKNYDVLVRRRNVLMTQISDLLAEIKEIGNNKTGRIGVEVATNVKIQTEIAERRLELVRLYARLEEAVAAREIALGQERDMETELKRTRDAFDKLARLNMQLEAEIAKAEGVTPSNDEGK
jgi:hypothetical protein